MVRCESEVGCGMMNGNGSRNSNRCVFFFFFFQAEDGIRDHCVTGVQTCALPIWRVCFALCVAVKGLRNVKVRQELMAKPDLTWDKLDRKSVV